MNIQILSSRMQTEIKKKQNFSSMILFYPWLFTSVILLLGSKMAGFLPIESQIYLKSYPSAAFENILETLKKDHWQL